MYYKVLIRASIKKFYKWLWGKSRTYPEIVEWIADTLRLIARAGLLIDAILIVGFTIWFLWHGLSKLRDLCRQWLLFS